MLLVDTSVWIDHLNHGDAALAAALQQRMVLVHPFVTGELALGNMRNRSLIDDLRNLPAAQVADDDEVHAMIERQRLFGLGIGYVDAHLLASTLLTANAKLWSRDKRLQTVADMLGCAATVE